jgi:rubredoxin
MWKIECPNCHHLFSVVTEENKVLIDDEKAEDIKNTPAERVEEFLEYLNPVGVVPMSGSKGNEVKVDDLTYEYRFKCKHCGYEWTELKEKERVAKS